MRKGGYSRRTTQTRALRKAQREEKEKSHRGQEKSDAARASFLLVWKGNKAGEMGLKVEIQDAVKAAMKAGDRLTLSILRLLLSALHNEEIKSRRELSTEEIHRTLSTLCKQRTEAIELFRKGGREELAQKEEAELKVLQHFLPQQLSESEVRALIQSSIEEVGAKNVQDLGKVMKQVMPRVSGRVDGKRVNELAKELLEG